MAVVWNTYSPDPLPSVPLLDGTTETIADHRVRFQPDAGPPIMTNLFTKPVRIAQMRVGPLRDYGKDRLEWFYEVACKGGVVHFEWTSAAWAGATHTFRFLTVPTFELQWPAMPLPEATPGETVGTGYPVYATNVQRRWIATLGLERFPWYPLT